MEHRWGDRICVDLPVRISSPDGAGAGVLRNLSISGAFIETALPFPLLALVKVQVPRGGQTMSAPTDAWGFVVRRDGKGVGVEWCELAPVHGAERYQRPGGRIFALAP